MEHIKTPTRLNWIDYTKGIGIIFVIVGHAVDATTKLNIWIYSFHLALFFIVSGLTIKKSTINMPIHKILIKYLKSLIVPYYILGFCCLLIELVKDVLQKDITVDSTLILVEKYLFLAGIKADWFLPALFFAIVLAVLLLKLFKGNKTAALLVSAVLAALCSYFNSENRIIIMILRIGVSTFLVLFGYLISDLLINKLKNNTIKEKMINLSLFVVFTLINIPIIFYNGKVTLADKVLGNYPVLFFVTGILGTLSIAFFCKFIDSLNLRILKYTGKNSIVIMAVHMEIMALLCSILNHFVSEGSPEFIIINVCVTYVISLCSIEFVNLILPNKKSKLNLKILKSKH